jgi:hypothetical protein
MQCLDQRAQLQATHGIHGLFPAAFLTEAAQPRIFLGLRGRGNTGLAHCLGHLGWLLHGLVLLGVMPHAGMSAL